MLKSRHLRNGGGTGEGEAAGEIGAHIVTEGVAFRVWAPKVRHLAVQILAGKEKRTVQLHEERDGYFSGIADQGQAGDRYLYLLDGSLERPDPASRLQPQGVHGPSQVVDPGAFRWTDAEWRNPPLRDHVIYELHIGTFSREGTFAGVIPLLGYLKNLGVTAIELMPVVEFPGERNWGYDGVFPYAPHSRYGGPEGLKALVDACHARGLAVIIDVVYNHLGPEGNYLRDFGYYFTGHYRTPWGDAINFDGPYSDHVRHYFIRNAVYWIREYHADALRLDAVHGIYDFGARHFLEELNVMVHREGERSGRRVYVIAESDLNDIRLLNPPDRGGYGIDAQWNDDFHHAVHTLLTGERDGYYRDFGSPEHLVKALAEKFVYSGDHSPYRRRRHGNSAASCPDDQFIVYVQNHDQIGNRMLGERLSSLLSFESLKLAAGLVLLSPYIPLLFMGEEYGEDNPFLYFVSHGDPDLISAVRAGRKEEFSEFTFRGEPPDPEALETFLASKLALEKREAGTHRVLFELYRHLIELRRTLPAIRPGGSRQAGMLSGGAVVWLMRHQEKGESLCLYNMGDTPHEYEVPAEGVWEKVIDSAEKRWAGTGTTLPTRLRGREKVKMTGRSFALYVPGGET